MWFGMIRSRLRFSSNFFRAIRLDDAKRIGTLVVSEGEGYLGVRSFRAVLEQDNSWQHHLTLKPNRVILPHRAG